MKINSNNIEFIDGKPYVNARCWVIPTDKKSNIGFYRDIEHKCLCTLVNNNEMPISPRCKGWEPQQLIITVSDNIEWCEWCLSIKGNDLFDPGCIMQAGSKGESHLDYWNKIVGTSGELLNVPQLHQFDINSFTDAYNDDNNPLDIHVECEFITTNEDFSQNPVKLSGYYQIKLNSNKQIIMYIIKTPKKTSWDFEELTQVILDFADTFVANTDTAYQQKNINDWIKTNFKLNL